ncbi:MAG: hypothetical protein ACSHX0_11685 [Akkermansiaceae bacterium]
MVNSNLNNASDESSEESQASADTLMANGTFLFQMFSELLGIYGCENTLNIVSEEEDTTLSAGMIKTDQPGEMDLNCVKLAPNQRSIRDCIKSIY